ncbi:MAG: hypothetical protein HQK76_11845 [Desulfobacterales bacterium]|nr:hypothetical protein [Desulfobacterales bacterium]
MKGHFFISPQIISPCLVTDLSSIYAIKTKVSEKIPPEVLIAHEFIHTECLLKDLGFEPSLKWPRNFHTSIKQYISDIINSVDNIKETDTKIYYLNNVYLIYWICDYINDEKSKKKIEKEIFNSAKRQFLSKVFSNCTVAGLGVTIEKLKTVDLIQVLSFLKTFFFWRQYDQICLLGALLGGLKDVVDEANDILSNIIPKYANSSSEMDNIILYRLLISYDMKSSPLYISTKNKLKDILNEYLDKSYYERNIAPLEICGAIELYRKNFEDALKLKIIGKTATNAEEIFKPHTLLLKDFYNEFVNLKSEEKKLERKAKELMDALEPETAVKEIKFFERKLKKYSLILSPAIQQLETSINELINIISEMKTVRDKIDKNLREFNFNEAKSVLNKFEKNLNLQLEAIEDFIREKKSFIEISETKFFKELENEEKNLEKKANEALNSLNLGTIIKDIEKFELKLKKYGKIIGQYIKDLQKKLIAAESIILEMAKTQRQIEVFLNDCDFSSAEQSLKEFKTLKNSAIFSLNKFDNFIINYETIINDTEIKFFDDLENIEKESSPKAFLKYEKHLNIEAVKQKYDKFKQKFNSESFKAVHSYTKAEWFLKYLITFGRVEDADVPIGNGALSRVYICLSIKNRIAEISVKFTQSRPGIKFSPIKVFPSDIEKFQVEAAGTNFNIGSAGSIIFDVGTSLKYELIEKKFLAFKFDVPDKNAVKKAFNLELDDLWPDYANDTANWFIIGM